MTAAVMDMNAIYRRGCMLSAQGAHRRAMEQFAQGLALQPSSKRFVIAAHATAMAAGEYEMAYRFNEQRIPYFLTGYPIEPVLRKIPIWDGSSGKRLLVVTEQGYGDVIQFSRFLPIARQRCAGLRFLVDVHLLSLIGRTMGDTFSSTKVTPDQFDAWCPLASLPLHLGLCDPAAAPSAPYLWANAERRAELAPSIKGTAPRIGLVLRGSPNHSQDAERSISDEIGRRLAETGISFFNLNPADAGKRPWVYDVPPIRDFDDTAALIAELDLVITVDTSVAHLAGALGKSVWILLRDNGDWRWLDSGEATSWYPSATLFRQQQRGDWATVIDRVCAALDTNALRRAG